MAVLRVKPDASDQERLDEEEKRRRERLKTLRDAEGAFGGETDKERHYDNYERLALDLVKYFEADNLDPRMSFYQLGHQVVNKDADDPIIGINFAAQDTIFWVTNEKVESKAPVDAAEEAFAIAALAKATYKDQPVAIEDCKSDYELFLVYKMAKDLGLNVKNEAEIEAKLHAEQTAAQEAAEEFQRFKDKGDVQDAGRRQKVDEQMSAARQAFTEAGKDKPARGAPADEVKRTFAGELEDIAQHYGDDFDEQTTGLLSGVKAAVGVLEVADAIDAGNNNAKPVADAVNDPEFADVSDNPVRALEHLAHIYAAQLKDGNIENKYTNMFRALVPNVLQQAAQFYDGADKEQLAADIRGLTRDVVESLPAQEDLPNPPDFVNDLLHKGFTNAEKAVVQDRLAAFGFIEPSQAAPEKKGFLQRIGLG